jgi:hypothetical protein
MRPSVCLAKGWTAAENTGESYKSRQTTPKDLIFPGNPLTKMVFNSKLELLAVIADEC